MLLVLDRSAPLTEADVVLMQGIGPALTVANKADLPAAWEPVAPEVLTISAQRGDGIPTLASAIARRLVPEPPPPARVSPSARLRSDT